MLRFLTPVALLVCAANSWAAPAKEAWSQTARYRFEYQADFAKLAGKNPGKLRIWLPYPAETSHQRVLSATVESSWPYRITTDGFANRMVYLEGDGVPDKPIVIRLVVERRPSDGVRVTEVSGRSELDPKRYTQPNTFIPLQGVIRDLAVKESQGHDTDQAKVRAFYDYVVRNMRYNKDGTGWGRGDAIWACTNKRGNCTDFHSLFIGMSRSQGIPARFIIGVPIPTDVQSGVIPGYHCWAEYYDQTRGWLPVDASEANKSGQTDAYFNTLPNDRIEFVAGRDLTLEPPQSGPALNYFIYPYVEDEGTPLADVATTFRFERLPAEPVARDGDLSDEHL